MERCNFEGGPRPAPLNVWSVRGGLARSRPLDNQSRVATMSIKEDEPAISATIFTDLKLPPALYEVLQRNGYADISPLHGLVRDEPGIVETILSNLDHEPLKPGERHFLLNF